MKEKKEQNEINYKKEIIKDVTINGGLRKSQMIVIKTYLKTKSEDELKDMYEKIQKEGLNSILDKFKNAGIVQKVVK